VIIPLGENYKYVWSIPLLSGILAIIAVVTPVASINTMGISWNWWVWNLSVLGVSGLGSESVFITEVDFMIPSLITTSILIFSIISLLLLALKTRTRKLDTKNFESISVIIGVLLIGITIYYSVAMDIAFYDGIVVEGIPFPAGIHFWDLFSPSFGVIGPFLSALLALIGAGVFRYYSKRKGDLIPSKMGIIEKKGPIIKSMGGLNFCPECGQKIISATQRFCMNCGFELQNI
jgi:hypothetical protein